MTTRASPPLKPREVTVQDFLRGRDVPCPVCGYDLRDSASDICPECGTPMRLQLGSAERPAGYWVMGIVAISVSVGQPLCVLGYLFAAFLARGYGMRLSSKEGLGLLGMLAIGIGCLLMWLRLRRQLLGLSNRMGWNIASLCWLFTPLSIWMLYLVLD